MARRKRKTLLGRKDRQKPSRRNGTSPVPRLGRRKALWRFVGAMALAPFGATAYGQDVMMPGMMPGGMGAPPIYAPQAGYPPVVGPVQAGYQGSGPGYVTPVQGTGPMVPPPMVPQSAPGIAIPSGSVFTPRLATRTAAGDGLGWDDGYTSIGAWLPLGLNNETNVLYIDARGFVSYDESGGGNFTLGYRYYMPAFDRFVGVYGAYDIDAGNTASESFNRFAVGAESVGRYLTYRVNGYIPIDTDGQEVASGLTGDPFFRGNHILFLDRTLELYQYGGVDGEVGGPLPLVGKYGMSGFLGGYYLTSDIDDTVGFQGRLEANINDDLQIGGKLTTDDIFDTNVWATLTLRSPKGSWANFFRKDWLRPPSVQTQMDRAPERATRIATDLKTFDTESLAINPLDGLPYLVLHVNPNGGSGPGTFENPSGAIDGFNNGAYDIVYVRPGTIATNGPIELFDNQRLLSTSVPHFFDTQRGLFQLPGQTGGPLPLLVNVDSSPTSVVLLANNNEVSGFHIDGTAGVLHTGIASPLGGITSFNINRNLLTNVDAGVSIAHVGIGTGVFNANRVIGSGFIPPLNRGPIDFDFTNPLSDFSVPRLGGPGFELATDSGQLDMTMVGNRIENSTGAGAAFTAGGSANVSLTAVGNEFYSNVDDLDALTPYSGQGMFIGLTSGAQLTNSVIDGNFFGNPNVGQSGNEGAGLDIRVSGNAAILDVLIGNEDGDNDNGNVFFNNGFDFQTPFLLNIFDVPSPQDGIFISRTGSAVVNDLRIVDNFMGSNARDGVGISASGSLNDSLSLTLAENQIQFNGDDGVSFFIEGNGIIDGTVTDNVIVANGQKDIFDSYSVIAGVREFRNELFPGGIPFGGVFDPVTGDYINVNTGDGVSFEENRFVINPGGVTGVWSGNFIADNFAFGVRSDAPTRNLVFGTPDAGNVIVRNGLTGVAIRGAGAASYTNNLIAENGLRLATFGLVPGGDSVSAAGGVDIEDRGFKNLTFVSNRIVDNLGDGVEISNRDNFGGFGFTLNFVDNIVANNAGRGYDVLNAGDATTDLTIRATAGGLSLISENGREGIYVVNTSAENQTQLGLAPFINELGTDPTHGMLANGAFDEFPFLNLTLVNNDVISNGNDLVASGLPAAGVVLRVGTAGGGYGPFNDGGFASSGRPGVIATITDNRLLGNLGADIYAESFTSTVDPPGTTGTWTDSDFDITNYDGDPLARLDLTFVNNTFNTVDFTNPGAFYTNAEGTFKSRTTGTDPEDGPFQSATRRRNAQRVGYRDETLPSTRVPLGQPDNDGGFWDLDPQPGASPPPSERFLYAGMGESTFRISNSTLLGTNTQVGPDGTTVIVPANFLFSLDFLPYNDPFNANGIFVAPGQVDDMPYGWSTF